MLCYGIGLGHEPFWSIGIFTHSNSHYYFGSTHGVDVYYIYVCIRYKANLVLEVSVLINRVKNEEVFLSADMSGKQAQWL